MATLPTKSFNQIVTNTISGIQGRASKLINFSQGSTLRAVVEGFAGTFLWFEALVLELLKAMRLSTAAGSDVDTFTGDYMPLVAGTNSPRLGSQASSGQVTFSRFTTTPTPRFIPVGASLTTSDGSVAFTVISDTTYATYSSTLQGYTLPANVASILVPVAATTSGSAGNVAAGAISVMTSPITGIDAVTNNAAFTNGFDKESDSALKKRFAAYILGLSRGDIYGLEASILGVAPEVQWALTENYNYDGSYRPGFFFVVADDGSGNPTYAFLAMVEQAAQAVRPLGIQCAIFPPQIIMADVAMQLTTADGYDHNTVVSQVAATLATNIDSLGLGNDLEWSILATWAYQVPGVTKVRDVLLNGIYGDAATLVCTVPTQDGALNYVTGTIKANILEIS